MDKSPTKAQGLAFGRILQTTFKTVVMYSVDHPAGERLVQQAYASLSDLLKQAPQFTFGFLNGRLLLNGILTDEASLALLEAEFSRRGVAAITFTAGISLGEFKRALSILAASPRSIDETGGIKGFLAQNPLTGARVVAAKKQKCGDTVLGMDSESFLIAEELLVPQVAGAVRGLDLLLQYARMDKAQAAASKAGEILELAGRATETALVDNAVDPRGVLLAFARLLEEFTPEYLVSVLPAGKQNALRGRSANDVATDLVEDVAVGWAARRLSASPAGPEADAVEDEVIRVLMRGLEMTRVMERLLQKLARLLEEANLPPEVFERIRQGVLWNALPAKEKRERLLQLKQFSPQDFRRLVNYVNDSLSEGQIDDAVQVMTHYFGFLESTSADLLAELPRAPDLLHALARPAMLSFLESLTERLSKKLLDDKHLGAEAHALVAEFLTHVAQIFAAQEAFESLHKIGVALERSLTHKRLEHLQCCAKALASLLMPAAAARLVDLHMEKRGDSGGARTAVTLLRWAGPIAGEEVFRRLTEESAAPSRMRLMRLLTQLGSAGIEPARKRLADERWYVVRNACCVLGDLGDPEAPQRLQSALRHPDGRVQHAAVVAIAKNQAAGGAEAVIEALPHLQTHVVELALDKLSFHKDSGVVEGLEQFIQLNKGSKAGALEKAVRVLAAIPSDRAVVALGRVLSDTEHAHVVRRAVLDGLMRSSVPRARLVLAEFARRAPTDPLAEEIRNAFSPEPAGGRPSRR